MPKLPKAVQLITWYVGYPDDFAAVMRFIEQTNLPITWVFDAKLNEIMFYSTKKLSESKLMSLEHKITSFFKESKKEKS